MRASPPADDSFVVFMRRGAKAARRPGFRRGSRPAPDIGLVVPVVLALLQKSLGRHGWGRADQHAGGGHARRFAVRPAVMRAMPKSRTLRSPPATSGSLTSIRLSGLRSRCTDGPVEKWVSIFRVHRDASGTLWRPVQMRASMPSYATRGTETPAGTGADSRCSGRSGRAGECRKRTDRGLSRPCWERPSARPRAHCREPGPAEEPAVGRGSYGDRGRRYGRASRNKPARRVDSSQ